MRRFALLALAVTAIAITAVACADRTLAPTAQQIEAATTARVARFETQASDTFILYPCWWELRQNPDGRLYDTLVCAHPAYPIPHPPRY